MSDADKLKQAIVSGDLNKLKKVLRQSRRTELHPLHACAQHGYLDGLNYLISKKWDVNARDGENWTALHSSCHCGHLYSVELLLDNGADPSIQTDTGALPLHYFVRIQRQADLPALFTRLFHLLIPENVNVDTTTVKSETALHDASFRGREIAVNLLLKANANPDVSNKYGDYPLHLAVRGGHPGVVKLLLEAGASTSVSNNQEGTPMELAKLNQNEEIIALLAGCAAENDAAHEDGVENGDTFTNGDSNGHHHGEGVAKNGERPEGEDQVTASAYALHNDGTPFAYPMVPAGGVPYQGNDESHYEDAAAPVRDPPPAMPVPQAPAPVGEPTTDAEPYTATADASQYTNASQYTDAAHYANGGQYAPSVPAMYGDGTQYPSQMGMGTATYNPYMSNAFMQLQMMQMMHQRMSQAQMGQYPQAGQGNAGGVTAQTSYGAGMQYPPQFAQQYYSQQIGSQGSVSRGGGYPQQPQVQQPQQMGGYPSYASASGIARPGQQQQPAQQQYAVNSGMSTAPMTAADPSQSAYGAWPQQYGVAQGAPPAVNPGYGQPAPVGAAPQQYTDEQYQQQQQAYLAAIQAQQAQLAQQLEQQGYPTAQGGSRPPSYDSANNL